MIKQYTAEQPKPRPWKEFPKSFMPLDLVDLMPGLIGQKRAYSIARQIGKKYGRTWVIKREDFFNWLTGDDIYSTALKEKEKKEWAEKLQARVNELKEAGIEKLLEDGETSPEKIEKTLTELEALAKRAQANPDEK
jgi:hypothetical protein